MQLGIDSFAWAAPSVQCEVSPAVRMANLLQECEVADSVGLDAFGIGEHHRAEFLDSAPAVILAAAAARTKSIRLQSAVTVLGAADPVRVFQDFATIDLISNGRAEIVAGRGSSVQAFPLFGRSLDHYDELFAENLDLLLQLRRDTHPKWAGRFRSALDGMGIYPRPVQEALPIWLGVGGTPSSFVRAGRLGLPLMVAIIGGSFRNFRPLVDAYRGAIASAGYPIERACVGVHAVGFVAETDEQARNAFFPGWRDMWARLGPERGWPTPTRSMFDAMCRGDGAYIVGSAETVSKKLLALSTTLGGVTRVHLQMSSATDNQDAMLESIRLLGTRVKPLVTAATIS